MIDRILAPLLAFVLLIAGTFAMGAAMFFTPRGEAPLAQAAQPEVIMLEKVIITAPRERSGALPAGHETRVSSHAAEGRGVLLQRTRD
jgi:hypothetical protein